MTLLARLVLTAALAGNFAPEFNRQEPITLDLKDASVTDVITMLGALANVPVSIAPDVTGTVTIDVKDVPYSKVLEMISAHNALSIRFEGGKLVATRASASGAVSAPRTDRALAGARIPVEDFASSSSKMKPLFFRVRANGVESCSRIDVEKGGTFEVPVPGLADPALVTQFGWDAASRTRFVAVEMPGAAPAARALAETEGSTFDLQGPNGTTGWSILPRVLDRACPGVAGPAQRPTKERSVIRMEVTEPGGPVVMAPQVNTFSGMAFSMRSGAMGATGQHDETVIFGYLSADGRSLAVALQATAIRTDPQDGKEYVYSQVSPSRSVRFTSIGADPTVLTVLPRGPAREKPLELTGSVVPPR